MAEIVISEFMEEASVNFLKENFTVLYDKTLVDRQEELIKAVSEPDCKAIIVRNRTQVRGAILEAANNLKVVGRLGVGLDNIDVAACKAKGIKVFPATGANAISVAEYVMSSLFILFRGVYHSSANVAHGEWPRPQLNHGLEIFGKTIGLIGFGDIAQKVCVRASACGMNVIAYDPYLKEDNPIWEKLNVRQVSLQELLSVSDAISLHVPLTDSTRNLINSENIGLMKKGAVLINSARGGIIDEDALAEALSTGKLAGAAIDVFQPEPIDPKSKLAAAPNCILTPHIAGLTAESNVRVSSVTASNVANALKG